MDTTSRTGKSGWWIAYFVAFALLCIAGLVFWSHSLPDLLASIFNCVGLVGLWGYLSDKAIGWRQLWVAYACLMFLIAAIGFGPGLLQGIRSDFTLFAFLATAAIFSLPGWWAIWRYAFRSPHIWKLPSAAA